MNTSADTRECATPECRRSVGGLGHRYCTECFAVVWRTSRPPATDALGPRRVYAVRPTDRRRDRFELAGEGIGRRADDRALEARRLPMA